MNKETAKQVPDIIPGWDVIFPLVCPACGAKKAWAGDSDCPSCR